MRINKKPLFFRTTDDIFTWFEKFTNLEQGVSLFTADNYNLKRMARFLQYFAHPENAVPAVHIAGSKGKGSTAALIAGALQAAGYKTGLYTSPHVTSYLERIRVDAGPPDAGLLLELANQIHAAIVELTDENGPDKEAPANPTTFELLTLLGFLVFRAMHCDFAVIETGLGGRLDATNLITPLASLITPIDLEHTRILGDTLEKIALEKCGIIKNGRPVFSGLQKETVKAVIRDAAGQKGSPVYFLDEEITSIQTALDEQGSAVKLKYKTGTEFSFHLRLIGDFQAENAALAYLALTHILPGLQAEAIQAGFNRAYLPGRFEIIDHSPRLKFVLDGAHTPLAVRRLLESYRKVFAAAKGTAVHSFLIFGAAADKNYPLMADQLAPWFQRIVISTPGHFKQSEPEQVYACFRERQPATQLEPEPAVAYKTVLAWAGEAASRGETAVVLVTGSFYMVAEIRQLLAGDRREV